MCVYDVCICIMYVEYVWRRNVILLHFRILTKYNFVVAAVHFSDISLKYIIYITYRLFCMFEYVIMCNCYYNNIICVYQSWWVGFKDGILPWYIDIIMVYCHNDILISLKTSCYRLFLRPTAYLRPRCYLLLINI